MLEQTDLKIISDLLGQQGQTVADVEQPGLSMGWMMVHHRLSRHNHHPYIVVGRENFPSDEVTLGPDDGHHPNSLIRTSCSQGP